MAFAHFLPLLYVFQAHQFPLPLYCKQEKKKKKNDMQKTLIKLWDL